jgi:glycine/D-amino acid oxidase-like deaminating enzyme
VDGVLEDVLARARELFPALQSAAVLRRWAGLRPRAKSRAPMVGRHPMRSGEYVANGGFKIGFGIAPGIGEMLADLVLDGVDRVPEDFAVSASL